MPNTVSAGTPTVIYPKPDKPSLHPSRTLEKKIIIIIKQYTQTEKLQQISQI